MNKQGIISWMAHNPVAANLLMIVTFLLGFYSLNTIKKEVFPTFPSEVLTITVPYPGGSPEETEESILLKVEEAISDIDGIKEIRSQASSSSGQTTITVHPGTDINDILNKVTVRVNGISSFPKNAEKPVISEQLSRVSVIRLTAYGMLDEAQLKALADEMRDDLLKLGGITQIDTSGTRDYEISIEISYEKLLSYNLSFDEIASKIQAQSINLPSGSIRSDIGTLHVRMKNQAYNAAHFRSLTLLSREDGTRISLGDIATVRDSFEEQANLSKFNGLPAVSLNVYSIGKQNALNISKQVRHYAENKMRDLPNNIQLVTWADRSKILESRIDLLLKNATQGGLLVILTLALFLQPTVAFWVILGIPFAFLGTLFVLSTPPIDASINVISLFGFILVLGIVVDDAIVTAESAYTTLEEEKKGIHSIIKGVKRVTQATVFGAITTMIAFSPMLFIESGMGRFFSVMSPVVIFCLIFSLIETKLILPSHLRHVRLNSGKRNKADTNLPTLVAPIRKSLLPFIEFMTLTQQRVNKGMAYFIENIYKPCLNLSVQYRYLTLSVFISIFIFTIAMLPGGWVRFVFFPNVPSDTVRATLVMPIGTSFHQTKIHAETITNAALKLNQHLRNELNLSEDLIQHISTVASNDITVSFLAELTPSTERDISSLFIAKRWRELVGEIPGVKELSFEARLGHRGSAIDIQIEGDNLEELRNAASDLSRALRTYEGVFDIRDTFGSGGTEVHIHLTALGESLGLTQMEIARQVRQALFGAEIQRVQRGRHEVRVYTRYPEADRSNVEILSNMWISLRDGSDIPFSKVARTESKPGISSIHRMNRHRIVNVKADVDKNHVEPSAILSELQREIFPELQAKYPSIQFVMEGEAKDQAENIQALGIGFVLVLFLIYATLAIPLSSYTQPLYIMSAIPFGVVGAILGHYLSGKSLSILSIIGIIALSGIVVNDSLVLVDDINQRVKKGINKMEAVLQAGARRFRAVILTSLTTFMGLAPLLLEKSIQAQFLIPMATSVAFGILFATSVTLILLPVLFFITHDLKLIFVNKKI